MVDYNSVIAWLVLLPVAVVFLVLGLATVVFYYRHHHSLDTFLMSFLIVLIFRVMTLLPVQASLVINDLKWSREGCQSYFWWSLSLQVVEILHLVGIATDRLIIVRMPLRYHYYASETTINTLVVVMWLVGCCGSLPLMFWVTKDYSNTRCQFVSDEMDKGFAIFGFVLETTLYVILIILLVDCFLFLRHNRIPSTIWLPENNTSGHHDGSQNHQKEPKENDEWHTNSTSSPFQRGGPLRKTLIYNNPKRFTQAYDTCKMGLVLAFTCIITNHLPYSIMALGGTGLFLDVPRLQAALLWFAMLEALAVPHTLWFFSDKYRTSFKYIMKYLACGKFGHGALVSANRTATNRDVKMRTTTPIARTDQGHINNGYQPNVDEYPDHRESVVEELEAQRDTMELGMSASFDMESLGTTVSQLSVTVPETENYILEAEDDREVQYPGSMYLPGPDEELNFPAPPEHMTLDDEHRDDVDHSDLPLPPPPPDVTTPDSPAHHIPESIEWETLELKTNDETILIDKPEPPTWKPKPPPSIILSAHDDDTRSQAESDVGSVDFQRGVSQRGSFLGSGFNTIMKARKQHVDRYHDVSQTFHVNTQAGNVRLEKIQGSTKTDPSPMPNLHVPDNLALRIKEARERLSQRTVVKDVDTETAVEETVNQLSSDKTPAELPGAPLNIESHEAEETNTVPVKEEGNSFWKKVQNIKKAVYEFRSGSKDAPLYSMRSLFSDDQPTSEPHDDVLQVDVTSEEVSAAADEEIPSNEAGVSWETDDALSYVSDFQMIKQQDKMSDAGSSEVPDYDVRSLASQVVADVMASVQRSDISYQSTPTNEMETEDFQTAPALSLDAPTEAPKASTSTSPFDPGFFDEDMSGHSSDSNNISDHHVEASVTDSDDPAAEFQAFLNESKAAASNDYLVDIDDNPTLPIDLARRNKSPISDLKITHHKKTDRDLSYQSVRFWEPSSPEDSKQHSDVDIESDFHDQADGETNYTEDVAVLDLEGSFSANPVYESGDDRDEEDIPEVTEYREGDAVMEEVPLTSHPETEKDDPNEVVALPETDDEGPPKASVEQALASLWSKFRKSEEVSSTIEETPNQSSNIEEVEPETPDKEDNDDKDDTGDDAGVSSLWSRVKKQLFV